jgi:hypothetical protein
MEEPPSGGFQLGNRGIHTEAWSHHVAAHGQEPIKYFEPRSMMQEHPHLDQESQRVEAKEQLDSASTYNFELL